MSVTAPRGFVAAGVHAGIRRARPDVALVRSAIPSVGAAMWTINRVQAAPVIVSKRHLDVAEPQAVVINAGVANAATGAQGIVDAERTAAAASAALGLVAEQIVVLSTGVIGLPLPMDAMLPGVEAAATALGPDGGDAAAEAILTTDSGPKLAVATGDGFVVGGMAKGAGMIHPCLATMLAVITTDYPLASGEGRAFLRPAVEDSFNRISVDGECSTNDAVILLANGASRIDRSVRSDEAFARALGEVCASLARQIVEDGEGATVLVEIAVSGASSDAEAVAVARRVATSPLVKTAVFGGDPNWGRVLAAAGSAPFNGGFAHLDPDRLRLTFAGTTVFADGAPTGREATLAGAVCRIELGLGLGGGSASYLGSDLSHDYVALNSRYTT